MIARPVIQIGQLFKVDISNLLENPPDFCNSL